jgi:Immune inhibitor A-like, MAM domain/Secretion system C-terminal sorting domain/Carboxypeptidase regulatory-like domain
MIDFVLGFNSGWLNLCVSAENNLRDSKTKFHAGRSGQAGVFIMKTLLIMGLMLSLACLTPCLADVGSVEQNKVDILESQKGLVPVERDPVPHIDATGGPDTFGYTWIDSDEVGGPSYGWIDITGTGTEIAVSDGLGDDDRTGPYPTGILFPFYGHGEEYFWVQSNGLVSFNGELVSLGNTSMPNVNYGSMIALCWDDLDPRDGLYGSVYYDTVTIGLQDVCVITFDDYSEYLGSASSNRITMQVLLYDDGLIRIQYQNVDAGFDCTSCTIGIQNHDGTDGLTYVYNDGSGSYPNNSLVVDFDPPTPTSSLSGIVYQSGGGTVANANVRVGCGQTTSDAAGNYTITGVYPGTYPYIVWKAGYDAINTVTTLAVGGNTLHASLSFSFAGITAPFSDNFEGGGTPLFQGWGEWEFGTPTYDPVGAYSGSNAWSTDLDNDYELNQDDWLKSQMGFVVPAGHSLKYYHWYDYESLSDGYNVWASTDAGAFWTMIHPTGGYTDPDGFYTANGLPCYNNLGATERMWVRVEFPLNNYVGQTVWIALRHTTDPSVNYSGVTIDNIDFGPSGLAPTITLTLFPLVTSVPSWGGNIMYDAQIVSTHQGVVARQVWTDAILPNGNQYGPMINRWINVFPGTRFYGNLRQNVPGFAPPGNYMFNGYIGSYPNAPETSDMFPFVKTIVPGADGQPVNNWDASDWQVSELASDEEAVVEMPADYTLHPVWPNPFNASATISVDLPQRSQLKVSVYSVDGRVVAELVNGETASGSHVFQLDGTGLASGIYFVHASVPGEFQSVQKITMIK